MIEIVIFVLSANIFFMGFFLMFASRIFHLKYSKLNSYLICFSIGIVYAVVATIGTYNIYYDFDSNMVNALGVAAMLVLVISRQIILLLLTDANAKEAFVYQLIYYFVTLSYYGFEDIYLYIVQNHSFMAHYEFAFLLIFKFVAFYMCGYFTMYLYQNTGIVYMSKRYIFIFVFCFFALGGFVEDSKYWYLNVLMACIVAVLYYLLIWKMSQRFEAEQIQELEEHQMQYIQNEYIKQSTYLEQLAKIRHDEKNHMLTFESLYAKDQEAGLRYLKQWQQRTAEQLEKIRNNER